MRSLLIVVAVLLSPLVAGAAEPPGEQVEFFEKHVRPVLVQNCIDCHGPDEAESKLRLDSLAGLLAGGERGPAIVPGKPKESLLLSAIKHEDVLQMPPKNKLSAREVADISKWIETGAAWPGTSVAAAAAAKKTDAAAITAADRAFWSFQTPVAPQPPAVHDEAWIRTPVDRFILSDLAANNLPPARPADRRALIRRATFDLTGLPPTPEEVESFVKDASPRAFEELIERLLASPHYGERWGRHWLDVARYADSNGMDENLAFINAFRYRDYVIQAFNDDKPYDQFVTEQLAGDLMPRRPGEPDEAYYNRVVATGFLSIGPKMLADDDPKKKEMDIIDEQLDTLGKAFLGLTLGCARCHDHKFDPLPAVDYYSLAGILKSTKTMQTLGVVAAWHENVLETKQEEVARLAFEQQLKEVENRLTRRKKAATDEAIDRERARSGEYLLAALEFVHFAEGSQRPLMKGRADDLAKKRGLDRFLLNQWVGYLGRHGRKPGSIWQPLIDRELQTDPDAEPKWSALAEAFTADAVAAMKAWEELYAAKQGKAGKLDDPRLEEVRVVLHDKDGPFKAPRNFDNFLPAAKEQVAAIEKERDALQKSRPLARRAMGVREGEVQNVRVHYRGNHTTLGPEAPRQFLRVIAGEQQTPLASDRSGRLELAQWLTSPTHPLTARVAVNRIWRWHFGRGIVRSVDNFGKLGERPTNQPLLDFLAVEFVKSGWSIKAMHRLIMNSSAYQMSTQFDSTAAAADPENLRYWRFERRRLEAEEVRDALLLIGGRLDPKFGGTTFTFKEREYVSGTGSRVIKYDATRRSVYLPVLRSAVYDVLQAFDFADPSTLEGNRATTTVAPQALFMMNGDLVADSAGSLADRLLASAELDDSGRVQQAFTSVLGREATSREVDQALELTSAIAAQSAAESIAAPAARRTAWRSLCRVLLASNEFIYVE